MDNLLPCVAPGSIIMFITFHGLERRIVKKKAEDLTKRNWVKVKHDMVPSETEIEMNPRSRSARLLALEVLPDIEQIGSIAKKPSQERNWFNE